MAFSEYKYEVEETIAEVADRFHTTVEAIMRLNNVSPPYPKYIKDLPSEVISNSFLKLPYVSSGGQSYEDFYNSCQTSTGIVYTTEHELMETINNNASKYPKIMKSVSFSAPNAAGNSWRNCDCYIIIDGVIHQFPCYPESVSDSNRANYSSESLLGSSEPIQIYQNSGPRTVSVKFTMHSDMCTDIGYIYKLVHNVESVCYPNYNNAVSAVKVTFHVAKNINITGIISEVSTDYSGPILHGGEPSGWNSNNLPRYAVVDLSFSVTEVTGRQLTHSSIQQIGGNR